MSNANRHNVNFAGRAGGSGRDTAGKYAEGGSIRKDIAGEIGSSGKSPDGMSHWGDNMPTFKLPLRPTPRSGLWDLTDDNYKRGGRVK